MSKPPLKVKKRRANTDFTDLKRQYERARLNAVRAQMAEREMEHRTGEVIDGSLYLMQKPLNVIKTMSDNLKRQMGEAKDGSVLPMGIALDEALNSGYAAMNSLRLSLPGDKPIAKAPVNINEAIRDVLIISADRLSANGIIADWQPASTLPMIYGEEIELRILLKILLENALMAVGDPLATDRNIRINTRLDQEDLIELCVSDSGPGIERELHSKIFEPFFTKWNSSTSNSGMGLAIAQQIVGRLRGEMHIAASSQSGCTICISLPACKSQKFEPTI